MIKEISAVVAPWNEAVAVQRAHPDEANAIMAERVDGWLKDPNVLAETLTEINFYGAEDNQVFYATKDQPAR